MVLIIYFLMNDNHAADAWAFAGILIRQAYALGLNRDPSIIVPHAHPFEKQQRRKVWQAVLFQDTFLTVILKLPPTATHNDVRVEDLALEVDESLTESGATGKFPCFLALSTTSHHRLSFFFFLVIFPLSCCSFFRGSDIVCPRFISPFLAGLVPRIGNCVSTFRLYLVTQDCARNEVR